MRQLDLPVRVRQEIGFRALENPQFPALETRRVLALDPTNATGLRIGESADRRALGGLGLGPRATKR